MEQIVQIIFQIYLWVCLGLFWAYSLRVAFWFFSFKRQQVYKSDINRKIAVIIPARNESAVIKDCLDSLVAQTYDPKHYDIHIVVASEDDPTIQIASEYKNTYLTIVPEQTCKGDALDGVLKKILSDDPDKYHAYLIVDADNIATPNLLEQMSNALSSGKQIIVGKKLIKNWQSRRRDSRSFISNCTALIYTMVDELGNRARSAFGIAVTVIGTGLTVSADVIKANEGWPYRSLTEDYELTADSIVKGWSTMYYSHAKVYTEEALSAKSASMRKLRWIMGHVECKRKYRKQIIKKCFLGQIKKRNLGFLVGTVPLSFFFGLTIVAFIFGLVSMGFFIWGDNMVTLNTALLMTLIPFANVYGSLFVFTLVVLIADRRNINIPLYEKLALLFLHPFYSFSYFRLYIYAHIKRSKSLAWKTIDRIPFE